MFSRHCFMLLIASLILGSCVSQQKYNALLRARDNLELKATEYSITLAQERTKALSLESKNQDLSRQLEETSDDYQGLNRELDMLRKENTDLSDEHQQLVLKFEDMRDYFDIVLNECDQDKIAVARKERQLVQQEDSLFGALANLRRLDRELAARESLIKAWEADVGGETLLIEGIYHDLNRSLDNLISPQFTIAKTGTGVKITIDEPVIFVPGSLTITNEGYQTLEQLAINLNAQQNIEVTILGHTDRNPIAKKAKYLSDNWDLSVLKAATVARALAEAKLDPRIVTVSGKGEHQPMVSNHTPEGRDKNKRTEIIIMPAPQGQATIDTPQKSN